MLGPRHLPTSIQLHSFETDLQKHYKQLEKIHKKENGRKAIDNNGQDMSKLFETRAKGLKFHNNEKAQQIEKDNELLLGKLVEISRKKKAGLANIKTEGSLPKTLHGPSRKREKDRIAAENEAFARRLLSQQPSFDRRKLELDYEKHNVRVKNMQKLIGFSPRKIKLPPLHKEEFDTRKSEKKEVKNNEKKTHAKKAEEKIAEDEQEYEEDDKKEEKEEHAAQKSKKSIVVDNHHGTSKQDVGHHSPSKAGSKGAVTEQKVASHKDVAHNSKANVGSHNEVPQSSVRDVSPSKKEVENSSVKDLAPAEQKEETQQSHREAHHESSKEVGEDEGLKVEKPVEEPKHDDNNIEEDIDAHVGMIGSKKL